MVAGLSAQSAGCREDVKGAPDRTGVEVKRRHHIFDLLSLLKQHDLRLDVRYEEACFLNAVYRSRYPADAGLLPHGEPTEEDACKALALARKVVMSEGKRAITL